MDEKKCANCSKECGEDCTKDGDNNYCCKNCCDEGKAKTEEQKKEPANVCKFC